MMVAIDANFRLKRRAVSSNTRDPALSSGSGFFVRDAAYREHVLKYADQADVSHPFATTEQISAANSWVA